MYFIKPSTASFDAHVLVDDLKSSVATEEQKAVADWLSHFADCDGEVSLSIEILCHPQRPATHIDPPEGGPEVDRIGVQVGSDIRWIDNSTAIDILADWFDEQCWEAFHDALNGDY